MTGAPVATVLIFKEKTVAKTLKRIDAGGIQIAALYSRRSGREPPRERAAKQKASSEAQRRMNQIYSYQKLELMLACNFPTAGSALVGALTFDDKHLPRSRAEAQQRIRYFLQLLRRERKKAGLPEPVVFWALEVLTSGRWHVHFVIDSTGQDLEILRRCWIYGQDIEAEKLRVDDESNHETLARYMTKELREAQEYECRPGLHGWSCTRNARRPEVETLTVPDDYELTPPEGCTVLIDENRQTEFASWRVIKYRFGGESARTPRARRRRRRRP